MKINDISFSWFDLVVVGVLAAGIARGRKRGMSQELLDVLQWLTIVVVSALYYKPVGKLMAGSTDLSLLVAYLCSYLALVVLIALAFSSVKRLLGEKLVGSDVFGRGEFYLGMGAGAVRFSCVLLATLALLHAKYISPKEVAAQEKMQRDNFGSISFPTFASVQKDVFLDSLAGRFISTHLDDQLISATPPGREKLQQEPLRNRHQREIDEVFGFKN